MSETDLQRALVAEAARKSSVCWLTWTAPTGQGRDRLAWHVWQDGSLLLVSGPEEQQLPGLAEAGRAEVVLRSAHNRARLATVTGSVEEIAPDDLRWPDTAAMLLAARLNHGPAADTLDRWRRECRLVVVRLSALA